MDKKKALKIATATTVAASAFVSVAPATFAASTSAASKAVTKAEADAKKVKDQYNAKKLAFKKIDTKAAVSSYNKAVAEVKKLSKGKTKSALESKLKAVKGIHTYAANYNKALDLGAALATATKNVNDELKKASFDLAGAKKDQAALKTATTNFSKHVVKGTVYGESPRAQFTAKYLTPAKTAATAVDKKIKAVEAELSDVKIATADVVALESAVKGLKDEATVATAEKLLTAAKASFAKVDTASVKTDLSKRISAAEKTLGDFKTEWNEVKTATADVVKLEEAVKALKDDATVKAAEDALATAKASYAKVDTETVKADLGKRIEDAGKAIDAKKAELAVPKVESVSAIAAKKVEVKFAKPVAEGSKASFTVKKGSSTIGVANIEWNEDKTAASLELSTKLSAGKYDISVAGLTDTALTASLEAQNERADELKPLSSDLVSTDASYNKDDINTAVVGYQLLNQYGEDITKEASLGNVTNGFDVVASTGSVSFSNGVLTWNGTGTNANAEASKVVLTLVNKATSKSSNVTLNLAPKSSLSTWELGNVFQLDGKSPSEDDTTGFNLLLSAKDQYGITLTDDADLDSKFTVVSSNPSVVSVTSNILDNIQVDKSDSSKVATGVALTIAGKGEATITVVENATGKSLSKKVTVAEGKKVDVVNIGNPDGIVAGQETIKVPLDVVTNKGTAVATEAELEAGLSVVATQNGDTVTIGNSEVKFEDGKAYLEFTTLSVASGATENLTLTVTSATNKVTTKTIQVKADAVPTTLVGLKSTVAKSIYNTATYDISDFVVEDQHGRTMNTDTLSGYKVTAADYDAPLTGAIEVSDDATVNTNSKGSELVKFTLIGTGADAEPISSVDTTLKTVVASDFVNYEVAPVETLYYDGDASGATYGEDFVVNGITASGEKVKLSEGDDYELSLPTGVALAADGKLYATAANVGVDADNSDNAKPETADLDGKVTLNINDAKELNFKVKVSAKAPEVSSLKLQDAQEKAIDTLTISGGTVTDTDIIEGIEPIIVAADQYGASVVVATTNTAGNDIKLANGEDVNFTFRVVSREDKNNNLRVTGNGTGTLSVAGLDDEESITVEIKTGSVTKTVKING
ncbi:hypothetical protein M1K46_02415 [Fictibacillus sp. WQ 8-8]|uniref:hypothetical protein n=1 Tax=Fictibacillus sp. WQ 8-8 TaxID=2938788 RepID=UPI00210A1190|nr:hypothetical protein [Fictibacillus sp. WQ 8-8]MCQ6264520.1 hypothetical protein [Fictibacillus sp. WQ 8-8]